MSVAKNIYLRGILMTSAPTARERMTQMDKDYVCNDCGAVFSVPDKHTRAPKR